MKSSHLSRDCDKHATSQRVDEWLASLGLACYTRHFLAHGYDVTDSCRRISDADLTAIGVTSPQHRLLIYNAVELLRHERGGEEASQVSQPFYFQLERPASVDTTRTAMTSPAASTSTASSMSEIHYDVSKYRVTSSSEVAVEGGGQTKVREVHVLRLYMYIYHVYVYVSIYS